MPINRSYLCPDCDGVFRFQHFSSDEDPPDYCPLCGSYLSTVPRPMPSMPHIGGGRAKSVDTNYRDMERASEDRMHLANAMLPAESSGGGMEVMKLTDMPSTDTPALRQMPQAVGTGMVDRQTFSGYAAQGAQGPMSGAGIATMNSAVSGHAAMARKVTAMGQQG